MRLNFLNPKIGDEIRGNKKVEEIVTNVFQVINENAQILNRIDTIHLLEILKDHLENKIQDIDDFNWRTNELLKKISIAESYAELRDIHADLNEIQKEYFSMLPSVSDLQKVCTDYRDRISKKVVSLVIRELISQSNYLPDESFAFISLGSDGRMEQTLITDQDNLIVYEDSNGRYKDFYYEKFSNLLVDRLAFCGFKKCTGNIMPSNPFWRGSMSQWIERVRHLCEFTSEDFKKNLVNLIVLTDLRFIAGDEELCDNFIKNIKQIIYSNHIVLNEISKSAASLPVAIGFMKTIKTEKKPPHKGLINIKLHAWAPMILAIRAFAIKNKVFVQNTIERIDALVKIGAFNLSDGQIYKKVYYTLAKFKIMCQIYYLDGIYNDSNFLNPKDLTDKEKEELVNALSVVESLQKLLIQSMGLRI